MVQALADQLMLLIVFSAYSLRRGTLRISPFKQERDADSDDNESPNQGCVEVDHAHASEKENDASDQKQWAS
jgi:hypothetical protein